ncbi:MAG: prepilin-type N-terminal cleavage/methylation domain-containing protein [Vicinamibacterales bacterium]
MRLSDSSTSRKRPAGRDGRRSVVVDGFQIRFVVAQVAWTGLLLVAFAVIVFGPAVYRLFVGTEKQQLAAADAFLAFHATFWPALLALACGLLVMTLTLSHRIAGPLFRFRTVFDAVASGQLWVFSRIRERDYPTQEAEALERMLESLRERIGKAQQCLREADRAATRLEPAIADGGRLSELRTALDAATRELAFYESRPPENAAVLRLPPTSPSAREEERPGPSPRFPKAGFTLVELAMVVAVIGILIAIALPTYGNVLQKAKTTRAIGDIRAIDREIQAHHRLYGCYPSSLAEVGYGDIKDPWGNPYVYNVLSSGKGGGGGGNGKGKGGGGQDSCMACNGGCINKGQARKDKNLVPINSDYDFYSMGADGKTASALTAQPSQDDIVRGSDGGFIGLGADY